MLTRIRCLLRLHRWAPEERDDGGRYKRCGDCAKSKRLEKGVYDIDEAKRRFDSGANRYTG
jgi:hypothetical protein